MEMYLQSVFGGFISAVPALVGWTVAVVLAAIMLRRGGARAERLLLIGASLMLLASILAVPKSAFATWLRIESEMTTVQIALRLAIFGLVRSTISLTAIICLVYAFWMKFKLGK